MFTGIVEEVGRIKRVTDNALETAAQIVLDDLHLGDSIAVNGVCVTVVSLSSNSFTVEVMPETLRRSNLGALRVGDTVNLERALRPTSRLGGHFVQGHVDGVGRLASVRPDGTALVVRIDAPPAVLKYVVEKGFIAVDGISLTVTGVDGLGFAVSLVGFTQQSVTLAKRRVGDSVNLEVDILGKYVERFTRGRGGETGITETFLAEHGFA